MKSDDARTVATYPNISGFFLYDRADLVVGLGSMPRTCHFPFEVEGALRRPLRQPIVDLDILVG